MTASWRATTTSRLWDSFGREGPLGKGKVWKSWKKGEGGKGSLILQQNTTQWLSLSHPTQHIPDPRYPDCVGKKSETHCLKSTAASKVTCVLICARAGPVQLLERGLVRFCWAWLLGHCISPSVTPKKYLQSFEGTCPSANCDFPSGLPSDKADTSTACQYDIFFAGESGWLWLRWGSHCRAWCPSGLRLERTTMAAG